MCRICVLLPTYEDSLSYAKDDDSIIIISSYSAKPSSGPKLTISKDSKEKEVLGRCEMESDLLHFDEATTVIVVARRMTIAAMSTQP